MRSDFFRQKPADARTPSDSVVEKLSVNNMFHDAPDGSKLFRVCFDVSQFTADEIQLRTHDHRLTVHAAHDQKGSSAHGGRAGQRS